MKIARFVLALAAILFFTADAAKAQDEPPVAMYTYGVFNENPLPVGTPVWVNIIGGDTDCSWGYEYPKATDECFAEYSRARIAEIFTMNIGGTKHWVYRMEPETRTGHTISRNAGFDDLFEVYNLPEKWAGYSTYFLRLNW